MTILRNLEMFFYESQDYRGFYDFFEKGNLWIMIMGVIGYVSYVFLERIFDKKLIMIGSCGAIGLFGIFTQIFGNAHIVMTLCVLISFLQSMLFVSLLHFVFLRFKKENVFLIMIANASVCFLLNCRFIEIPLLVVNIILILLAGGLFYLLLMRPYYNTDEENEYSYEMSKNGYSIFSPISNIINTKNLILISLFAIFIFSFGSISNIEFSNVAYQIKSMIYSEELNSFTLILINLVIAGIYVVVIKFFKLTDKIAYVSLPIILLLSILAFNAEYIGIAYYYIIIISLDSIIPISIAYLCMAHTKKEQFHSTIAIAYGISGFLTYFITDIYYSDSDQWYNYEKWKNSVIIGIIISMVLAYVLYIAINKINHKKQIY